MKTVGEILKTARLEKHWSIEELSSRTKIQEQFLEALERSAYDRLPEMPFVKGFIRAAAMELGLNPDTMVAIFRRDFGVDQQGNVIPKELEGTKHAPFNWTPTLTLFTATSIVITTFLGYLVFQLYLFASPPKLVIDIPRDREVVSQEVLVQGRTDPSATVAINGQEIKKNKNGLFSQTIPYNEGEHTLVVTATGQNGKSTTIERTIQVKHD